MTGLSHLQSCTFADMQASAPAVLKRQKEYRARQFEWLRQGSVILKPPNRRGVC